MRCTTEQPRGLKSVARYSIANNLDSSFLKGTRTMAGTLLSIKANMNVTLGQIKMSQPPDVLGAVLGSCVGAALYHRRSKTGALAHIVLPASMGRQANPGKFADIAIPHMIKMFQEKGIHQNMLVAKLFGGACMFQTSSKLQIGQDNINSTMELLKKANIPIEAIDVGGTGGRRVCFDLETGMVTVRLSDGVHKEF